MFQYSGALRSVFEKTIVQTRSGVPEYLAIREENYMEPGKISEKTENYNIEVRWNWNGNGKCSINIEDEFWNQCMTAFAKATRADLDIQITGEKPSAAEFMKKMGEVFAREVCQRCEKSGQYQGVGRVSIGENGKETFCELYLPGRVDWVYEMIAENPGSDPYGVLVFFRKFAKEAKLRLKMRTSSYEKDECVKLFKTLGLALNAAFCPV